MDQRSITLLKWKKSSNDESQAQNILLHIGLYPAKEEMMRSSIFQPFQVESNPFVQ